jgi:hypothetical protein
VTPVRPSTVADPANADSPDPRLELAVIPASPALAQAVKAFQVVDSHATFTWFRGHVDSFATRPRNTIPAYARPVLESAGLSAVPQEPQKLNTTTEPNRGAHLDDLTQPLPYVSEAPAPDTPSGSTGEDTDGAPPPTTLPIDARRPLPVQPSDHVIVPGEANAAKAILAAFLKQHAAVFEVDANLLAAGLPNLKLVHYGVGQFGRRLVFQQYLGEVPLLDGKTIVLLDMNWNVTAISRQITTAAKLTLPAANLSAAGAAQRATQALANRYGYSADQWRVLEATRGVDVIRGIVAWQVRAVVSNSADADYTVTLDGAKGRVLNISGNVDYSYTDAKLLYWTYDNGDFYTPTMRTAINFFTRDSNSLEHDFFYLANDNRSNDLQLETCGATPKASNTASEAYGSENSAIYIRPTQRNDRDFSSLQPGDAKGSFGEGHVYYWSRWYMQWLRGSFDDLGVLPANVADYPKVLLILNACQGGAGVHKSTFAVTTLDDKGEGTNTILLPERCRSGISTCVPGDYATTKTDFQYTFEGNSGYHTPGVVHHELNHFILKAYFDVNTTLDCAARNELKYMHEGGLGRTIPQMYWHHYYGVGYAPAAQVQPNGTITRHQLFQSDDPSGAPHTDASDINDLSNFPCDPSANPYYAGGVVAQPLWEIYHGRKVDGAVIGFMARPAEDLGMLKATYWALDMVSASTSKDRLEMANRFMEFWEFNSTALPTTKTDWCDVFSHHGLGTYILTEYCS